MRCISNIHGNQVTASGGRNLTVNTGINLLDVVAVTEDLPDRGLHRGQVRTVVEHLTSGVFEVEFSDDHGHTYATLSVRVGQLMALHHRSAEVA